MGIHRKNEELAKHSLIVSIQCTDVVFHVSTLAITTSQLETPVDPSPLTCSVPMSVISEGVVQTRDTLNCYTAQFAKSFSILDSG